VTTKPPSAELDAVFNNHLESAVDEPVAAFLQRVLESAMLSRQDFARLREMAPDCLSYYTGEAQARFAAQDFATANTLESYAQAICERLASAATEQIDQISNTAVLDAESRDADLEDLSTVRDEFGEGGLFCQATAMMYSGFHQRTENLLGAAASLLQGAAQLFARFRGHPDFDAQAEVAEYCCLYNQKLSEGLSLLQKLEYQRAKRELDEALGTSKKLLRVLNEPGWSGPENDEQKTQLIKRAEVDRDSVKALSLWIEFSEALSTDRFQDAVSVIGKQLELLIAAVEIGREGGMPEFFMHTSALQVAEFEGWRAYAKGECLRDARKWQEAETAFETAHERWKDTIAEAIALSEVPLARTFVERLQYLPIIVLSPAKRRLRREREFIKRIEELEAQLAKAKNINVARLEELNMGDNMHANVSGTGNVVVVGKRMGNVTNTVNQSNASGEVKQLIESLTAEIKALAEKNPDDSPLIEQMAADVETLSKEIASEAPRRKWYELSLEGLKEAAEAVGEVAAPILKIVKQLTPLLLV
jgi:tetratricopeptide (TPR) repeat protein